MKYQWDGDSIIWETQEGIVFKSQEIKKDRTGNHAKFYFLYSKNTGEDKKILHWSYFNFDKSEERQKFVKKSFSRIGEVNRNTLEFQAIVEKFDTYCLGLEDFSLGRFTAEWIEGNPFPIGPIFILEPFVIEGGGTILFAPPGRGKSYVSQCMALSIDSGNEMLWRVKEKRTLFVNLERPHSSMSDRIGSINRAMGTEATRGLLVLNARGKRLYDIRKSIIESVKRNKVEMVFVDSISRTGVGSLIADDSANLIIDILNQTCPTWLAIAHTPRKDSSHSFGSVMLEAGEDIGVQLLSQFDETRRCLGIGLKIVKANDIPIPSKPSIFSYLFDNFGLREIRRANQGEFPEIEAMRSESNLDKIKDFLAMGRTTISEISEATGIPYGSVSGFLSANKNLFVGTREGKTVLWGLKQVLISNSPI